jgi:hypothetical protein
MIVFKIYFYFFEQQYTSLISYSEAKYFLEDFDIYKLKFGPVVFEL